MTTIQNVNVTNVSAIDAARPSRAGSTPLLPAASSVNPATMLALLQLECLGQANKASEQSRDAYDLAEAAADKARVDEMNKKNTETMIFGIIGAATTAAQGGLKLASGFAEGTKVNKLEGGSILCESAAKAIDTVKAFNAGRKDVHIAEQEQVAKTMKRASERLGRAVDATSQSESKVRELIAEIVRGQDQTTRAALFRSA